MSEFGGFDVPSTGRAARSGRILNWLLFVLVAAEAAALWVATAWSISQMLGELDADSGPDAAKSAVALVVVVALAALWLSASAVGIARRRGWARGSIVTWQVMQVAIAIGAAQGERPNWLVTVVLLASAIAVVALILSRPVRALYSLDEPETDLPEANA